MKCDLSSVPGEKHTERKKLQRMSERARQRRKPEGGKIGRGKSGIRAETKKRMLH